MGIYTAGLAVPEAGETQSVMSMELKVWRQQLLKCRREKMVLSYRLGQLGCRAGHERRRLYSRDEFTPWMFAQGSVLPLVSLRPFPLAPRGHSQPGTCLKV